MNDQMGAQVSPPRRMRSGAPMEQPVCRGADNVLTTDEEAAFTALVQRQSRFVFRVAYAVLLNAHDAEDAVQETFLKLYRNGGWQHAENEQAFLARAAWRVALDRRRAAKSAPAGASPDSVPDLESPQPGTRNGPRRCQSARDRSRHDRCAARRSAAAAGAIGFRRAEFARNRGHPAAFPRAPCERGCSARGSCCANDSQP